MANSQLKHIAPMPAETLYRYMQQLFPALSEQHIPTEDLDSFGMFFDWVNLNATYIQPIDLIELCNHDFEDNSILESHQVNHRKLAELIRERIELFSRTHYYSDAKILQQDYFRIIATTIYRYLQQHGLDLLVIITERQKYWFSFETIADEQRQHFIQLFRKSFNSTHPVQLLDVAKLSLFV